MVAKQVAYLDGWFYVPHSQLDVERVKGTCTLKPRTFPGYPTRPPVHLYDDSRPGYLGLPIDWGLTNFGQPVVEDRTCEGRPWTPPRRPDPNHPDAPPGQAEFMVETRAALKDNAAILVKAGTGTGKSIVTLDAAAELGRTTLVLVPLQRLVKQWRQYMVDYFGMDPKDIGVIQGPKAQIDRPVCIGMMQSLAAREYPPEVYQSFGTVIFDEVHRCGSDRLAQLLGMFPAAYKCAATATDSRADKMERVIHMYFGQPKVTASPPAMPIEYKVLPYKRESPFWAIKEDMNLHLKCLQTDHVRNELIARLIRKTYDQGRKVIVIGHGVDHLEKLMQLAIAEGVPEEVMGQYTGSFGKGRQASADEYLDWVQEHAQIVYATYGMTKEAISWNRMDTGIDVTPQSKAAQVIGRIRRPAPGKKPLRWYTILDKGVFRLVALYKSRLDELSNDPQVKVTLP